MHGQTQAPRASPCEVLIFLVDIHDIHNAQIHSHFIYLSLGTRATFVGAPLQSPFGSSMREGKVDDSMSTKVLRTFVKNQCPAVKYKSLLHPPHGSIYKAARHFQDMCEWHHRLIWDDTKTLLLPRWDLGFLFQCPSTQRCMSAKNGLVTRP